MKTISNDIKICLGMITIHTIIVCQHLIVMKILTFYYRNYMNDSFRTNVFVRYSPETIACACIFLAARKLQFCLPSNPPWFALFDAREDDLKDISLEILRLYSRKKVGNCAPLPLFGITVSGTFLTYISATH